MKTDLLVISIVALAALSIAVFIFLKNQKDRKEFERKLNEPSHPAMKKVSDTESEDRNKI